jgi:hypothetical protein
LTGYVGATTGVSGRSLARTKQKWCAAAPGLSEQDRAEAETMEAQAYFKGQRAGSDLFRQKGGGFDWLISRTKCFGIDQERLLPDLAKLNICGCHSKTFEHNSLLAALPSCRVSIGWAQDVLFPQAEDGKRVVICLRSAGFWGLKEGEQYGRSLFAPPVTRGGHMKHGDMRERIIKAAKSVIGKS